MSTTIIIHKTATSIFAGADSKQSGGTTKAVYDVPLADKIVRLKEDWYFGAAHHVFLKVTLPNTPPRVFDVDSSMRRCANGAVNTPDLSLREFADSCSTEIKDEVRPFLQLIRNKYPPTLFYWNNFANKVILELVFFGRDKGSLVAYRRDIHASPMTIMETNSPGTVTTYIKPEDFGATWTGDIKLGFYETITQTLNKTPDYWKIGGNKGICGLISREIDKHLDTVGWPVKVLHLTAAGRVKWVTYQKHCK